MSEDLEEPFFLDDDADPASSVLPTKRSARWLVWIPLVFLGLIFCLIAVEVWGACGVAWSLAGLEKLADSRVHMQAAEGGGTSQQVVEPAITLEEIRSKLALLPRETSVPSGDSQIVWFTWPRLTPGRNIRVRVSAQGKVMAIDAPAAATDQFLKPIVMGNDVQMTRVSAHAIQPRGVPLRKALPPAEMFAEKTRAAFALPATPLPPGVLVLPFLDKDENTHRVGPLLAMSSSYQLAYCGRPVLGHDPRRHADTLVALNLHRSGWKIDADRIEQLKSMVNAKQWVRSTLLEEGAEVVLTSTFETSLPGGVPAKFEHRVPATDLHRLPALLTRDILRHLQIPWGEKDDAVLAKDQLESSQTLSEIQSWLDGLTPPYYFRDLDQEKKFTCLALADLSGTPLQEEDPQNQNRWLPLLRPTISVGVNVIAAEGQLSELLPLAPLLRGNARYHHALCTHAMHLKFEKLVEELLKDWEEADSSTSGMTARGKFLINWAWDARGGGTANEVTPSGWIKFQQRIARARVLLTKATADPRAWEAHCQLIIVGMAEGASLERVREHLQAATKIIPDNAAPYHMMYQPLMKRWGGNREERFAFAKECLATGQWKAGIPQIYQSMLIEEAQDVFGDGIQYSAWRDPEMWSMMNEYASAAMAQPDPKVVEKAKYNLLSGGIRSQRFDKVAELFDWVEALPPKDRERVLGESHLRYDYRHAHYLDQFLANSSDKKPDPLAVARVALVEQRLQTAERALNEVQGALPEVQRETKRLWAALELARRLNSAEVLELAPDQLLEVCATIGPKGTVPLSSDPNWGIESGKLVWTAPAGKDRTEVCLLVPIGTHLAQISGGIDLCSTNGGQCELIVHAQGMRDSLSFNYSGEFVRGNRNGRGPMTRTPPLAPVPNNSVNFLIHSHAAGDHVEPVPREAWDEQAHDDVPSALAIRFVCHGTILPGAAREKFGLRGLKIVNPK